MRLTNVCIVAISVLLTAPPALARLLPCTPLVFNNAGTATIHEHVPDMASLCYSFSARAGQTIKIDITKNDKMEFGVASVRPDDEYDPVVDERQSFQFTTEQKSYRVFPGAHAIHGNTEAFFTMTVVIK